MNDATVLSTIEHLTRVSSREELAEWAVTHLSGSSSVLIGLVRMQPAFSMTPYFVSASFPRSLIKTFDIDDHYLAVPLLQESRAACCPVMCELGKDAGGDALWQTIFRQKGFSQVAVAANTEVRDGCTTYLCLTDANPSGAADTQASMRRNMAILAPILHNVLSRLAFDESREDKLDPLSLLTRREREILDWIRKGKTNSEISSILGIAFSTIKNHVQRILIKLQVNNRTQAISKFLH
jgi:DNA-binding CsgD family transcriptional regulator